MDVINAIGRRKKAVARVYLSEGKGKITVNKKDSDTSFGPSDAKTVIVDVPISLVA